MNSHHCCVIGLGYIGLPTAAIIASHGHRVTGYDINPDILAKIAKGQIHINEPDLEILVSEEVHGGRLRVSPDIVPADVFIIAVPTPFKDSKQGIPQPDLKHVLSAAKSIATVIKPGNLVILESTSPVGTTSLISSILTDCSGLSLQDFRLAYCPERVLPGNIVKELVMNDRVIGGMDLASTQFCRDFYASFCKGHLLTTDSKTAELVKLAENSFRDVNVAFANELSIVCSQFGIDVLELVHLANYHPRVNILSPGCGVGGHCIAVDPWFIAASAPSITPLIQTARRVNNYKKDWVVTQIVSFASKLESQDGVRPIIGCLGLSYKPDVADLRESPAVDIVFELTRLGYRVLACEPNISSHPTINLCSEEELASKSDLIVLLVNHSAFTKTAFTGKPVFDPCGVMSKQLS